MGYYSPPNSLLSVCNRARGSVVKSLAFSIGGQLSESVSLQTRQKGRTSARTRGLASVCVRQAAKLSVTSKCSRRNPFERRGGRFQTSIHGIRILWDPLQPSIVHAVDSLGQKNQFCASAEPRPRYGGLVVARGGYVVAGR